MGEGTDRVEFLDEVLERQVLVGVRRQGRLPDPPDQLLEGGVAGCIGAQDKGVDEEPHQIVQRLVRTARHRAPDRDVRARSQPREQRCQTCLEHHEQARALPPGEVAQALVEFRVEVDEEVGAVISGDRRARSVSGEAELVGEVGQLVFPVAELSAEGARGVGLITEEGALPQGVVGVLRGQGLPVRFAAGAAGGVRLGEVVGEGAGGPAVAGDVVHDEEQDVFLAGEREQLGLQGEFSGQVEGGAGRAGEEFRQAGFVGVGDPEAGVDGVQDVLGRGAVRAFGEHRAEGLVAVRDIGEGRFEGAFVELSGEAQGEGDVVGGLAALHLVQEPQAALGERQRQDVRADLARQDGPGLSCGVQCGGESGDGRRLEQGAQREFHAEGGADPGGEAGGEQGVAAEVEEAVVRAYLSDAEHFGEESGEQLLAGCAGFATG
ncbi:hypothetical protein a10_08576 [Streptomyces acidiscabies]|nr:hypothetical protein a10_08576 [Streptomyces acidiscabies]GAV45532.1 hypothetical protein Saa2_08523 [Streptomyces acidiscabies]